MGYQGSRKANLEYLMQDADASLLHVIDDSALAQLMASGGDVSDYDDTTDSLEAISNAIGAVPTTVMRGTDSAYLAATATTANESAAHIPHFGGEIFYVNKSGDDANDGSTPHLAKLTIQDAIDSAAAGDAISIKAGTYVEDVTMNKPGLELWPEIGVVFDGTGTCITISADSCKLGRPGDRFVASVAADQIGVLVTAAGTKAFINGAMAIGAANTCGFDIQGSGSELHYCRATGVKATGKAFDIGVSQAKLFDCATTGDTTSYGYYMGGATISRGLVVRCTSAGHQTSGFYLDSNVSLVTVLGCSSGGSDGRWADVDNANVFCDFFFDDVVYATSTLDANNTTKEYNLFKLTGSVEITALDAHVSTVLSDNHTNCYVDLYSTTAAASISLATGLTLSSAPVGSVLYRAGAVTSVLTYLSSSQPRVGAAPLADYDDFVLVADESADTYIRFIHTTTNAPSSGAIHWHVKWRPLTDDGYLEAA